MAAHRRHAGEARHGYRARRSAGDDGARRQGARGADRDPRRHHDAAEGPAASRACSRYRSRMPRPARRTASCGRARKADDVAPVAAARATRCGSRGRIPPAALCGDDARGRPAGGRGRARREQDARRSAGTSWSRALEAGRDRGEPMTATARCCAGASRRGPTVRRGRRARLRRAHDVPDWLRARCARRVRAARDLAVAAARRVGSAHRCAAMPRALARGRIVHRLLQALPALPAERRAEAARQPSRARARISAEAERDDASCARCWRCSTMRASRRCSPRARAPRSRSSATFHRAEAAGLRPGRPPRRDGDRGTDRRLQIGPLGAAPRSRTFLQGYVGQLALYRAVLRTLYPNHRVRAALVWTARAGAHGAAGRAARRRIVKACGHVKTPTRDRALTLRAAVHTFRLIRRAPAARTQEAHKNRGAPWALQRYPIRISRAAGAQKRRARRGRFLGRVVRSVQA